MAARGASATAGAHTAHRRVHAGDSGRSGIPGPQRSLPARARRIGLDRRPQCAHRLPLGSRRRRPLSREKRRCDLRVNEYAHFGVAEVAAKEVYGLRANVQAIFFRRLHQPSRPPLAKISPGRPAPAMGPGTPNTAMQSGWQALPHVTPPGSLARPARHLLARGLGRGEVRFRHSENAPRCIPAPLLPYTTRKPAIKL